MPCRPPLVLVLALLAASAGCGDRERDTPPPRVTDSRSAPADAPAASSLPPLKPSDVAPIVFDTVEPPERVVEIPARPPPRNPDPAPRPLPPPPDDGPSGSCDVRDSEGFCFAYTGPGWTGTSAEEHCAGAPNSAFGPGTCPLQGRIATCAFRRSSDPARELVYTYYEPFDIGLAELACPGTFTRLR